MRNYFTILTLTFSFLVCSCAKKNLLTDEEIQWLKENKNLKVSTFGDYPPYQFKNQFGETEGIFIDYIKLIEQKINYKFNIVEYPTWQAIIEDTKKENIDIVIEIQKTKERSTYLNFYNPLFDTKHVIISRKDNAEKISYKNISKKTIVVPKDYAIADILKNTFPDINLEFEINEATCLKALNNGKYDAYIGPDANSNYHIHNNNLENLTIASTTPHTYRPTIAVLKKNSILSNIFSKANDDISIEERELIFSHWLEKKYFPTYRKFDFWIILFSLLGFFLIISLLFNWLLKKKVAEQTLEVKSAFLKAEKNSSIKTNFIQNISHEIRTPMNGILGYSELLKKEAISPEEQTNYINTIIDSGKDLVHIIDNMLEISDLQKEQPIVKKEITNISEVFENIISLYTPKATKKNIELILKNECNSKEVLILIDKVRFTKIIKNIVSNAVKYTQKGFVVITFEQKEGSLDIHVTDTGIGIKKKEQALIFDGFLQLEKEIAQRIGGIGIGLTVAKKNAIILDGEISFISEENKGSTFYIKLPYQKAVKNNESKQIPTLIPKEQNIYQILVAEDEEINFMLVNSILSRFEPYNFLITRAENGQEAVTICQENEHIDLILMDIRMPIMDGYEATGKIKKMRPKIPIIAHTAYSSEKDIQSALQAGCDTVIRKPINLKEFKETILSYIN